MNLPLLVLLAGALVETPETTERVDRGQLADVTLLALDGEPVRFGEIAGDTVLVLTYTGVGCPISGKYAPRLQRFSEEYGQRGVRFVGVDAGPQSSREDVAKERAELGIEFPVFKDHRQELTRRLGATTTTEVFLFDAQGLVDSVNVPVALLLGETLDVVIRGVEVGAVKYDVGAQVAHRLNLADVGALRDGDRRRGPEHPRGVGYGLAVVAAGGGGHAPGAFGVRKLRHEVDPAPDLERTQKLMVLVLDVDFRIEKLVERKVVVKRRAHYMRFDSTPCLQNVL